MAQQILIRFDPDKKFAVLRQKIGSVRQPQPRIRTFADCNARVEGYILSSASCCHKQIVIKSRKKKNYLVDITKGKNGLRY